MDSCYQHNERRSLARTEYHLDVVAAAADAFRHEAFPRPPMHANQECFRSVAEFHLPMPWAGGCFESRNHLPAWARFQIRAHVPSLLNSVMSLLHPESSPVHHSPVRRHGLSHPPDYGDYRMAPQGPQPPENYYGRNAQPSKPLGYADRTYRPQAAPGQGPLPSRTGDNRPAPPRQDNQDGVAPSDIGQTRTVPGGTDRQPASPEADTQSVQDKYVHYQDKDGNRVLKDPESGITITDKKNGDEVDEFPNGDRVTTSIDGTTKTEKADGTVIVESKDGSSKTTIIRDGTKTTDYADGSRLVEYTDHTRVATRADGTSTSFDANGNFVTKDKEGKVLARGQQPTDEPPSGEIPKPDPERQNQQEKSETGTEWKGPQGQVVKFDAAKHPVQIDYPNGLKVTMSELDEQGKPGRVEIHGNGENKSLRRRANTDQYDVLGPDGQPNGTEVVESVEMHQDGSAVIHGKKNVPILGWQDGTVLVSADGTTQQKLG